MIEVARKDDVTIIRLGTSCRSLDDDVLEEIGGVLLTEAATVEPPKIVLDLSETIYIGSTFIELLVRAWKRLGQREGRLALCCVQPFCAEVLRITRLDTLWEMCPTEEEAVAVVGQPRSV